MFPFLPAHSALKARLNRLNHRWRLRFQGYSGWEMVYRDLMKRELAKLGIEDTFWPIGSAANHSLMYVILRTVQELPTTRILDVGAGQSTLLLNQLAKKLKKKKLEIITLEHEEPWAKTIGKQVSHQVIHAPLTTQRIAGVTTQAHDLGKLTGTFDLVIMDSPQRQDFNSRLGLLAILQKHVDIGHFIAVMDDAERSGEKQTIARCLRWLKKQGATVHTRQVRSMKEQTLLIAGEAFTPARYY